MIARHEASDDGSDVFARIAAPVPATDVQFRQNGKAKQYDGKWRAPFVAYIDSQFVRARLDAVVPGNWDFTIEPLPPTADDNGEAQVAFKGRLQILGVIREDVGQGGDYKSAVSDTLKRCAVRYGVGHELYTDYEMVWVTVDGDGKFAKPLEDPATVYARKAAGGGNGTPPVASAAPTRPEGSTAGQFPAAERNNVVTGTAPAGEPASCPKCGGKCYDNRAENDQRAARGEKLRPDFACRDRACNGVIWRPDGKKKPAAANGTARQAVSIGEVAGLDDGYDGN